MPSKTFRVLAVIVAVTLGIAYVLWSLPAGAFGGSKAGIIRVGPHAQPSPTPTPAPPPQLMHSSKLGIFIQASDLSGEPARQTILPEGTIYSNDAKPADETVIPFGPQIQPPAKPTPVQP